MKINISINGVLRNLIYKFENTYENYYLETEIEEGEEDFEYEIKRPISNINILDSFKFQSIEEYENFLFIEYPLEIFGHAGVSYSSVFVDLKKFISEHKDDTITLVGLDELGKAKPATLFFLSKNGCVVDNIKFIKKENIESEWRKCDIWITDDPNIIEAKTNKRKKAILFETEYNKGFKHKKIINKLTDKL